MAEKKCHPESLDAEILKKIKQAGLKLTQSRLRILELLSQEETAMSPSEIFSRLEKKAKTGDVDRVTVYRILEKFNEIGLVHMVDNNKYVYCLHQTCQHEHHFILICNSCRAVQEVGATAEPSASLVKFLKKKINFKLDTKSMVLHGLCEKCSS